MIISWDEIEEILNDEEPEPDDWWDEENPPIDILEGEEDYE